MKKPIRILLLIILVVTLQACCTWCNDDSDTNICLDYPIYPEDENDFFLTINLSNPSVYENIMQTVFISPILEEDKFGEFKGALAISAKAMAQESNDSLYKNISFSDFTVRRLQGDNYKINKLKFYPPSDTKSGIPTIIVQMSSSNSGIDQVNSGEGVVIPELYKNSTLEVIATTKGFPKKLDMAIFTRICQDKIN